MLAVGAGYPINNNITTLSTMNLSTAMSPSDHPNDAGHWFVHFAEAVIQPILLSIGIITNIISLIVLKRTHIGAVFKICITALTISDLLASIFGLSQILVEIIAFNGNIPFGYYYPAAIASHTLYYLFLVFMCTSSGLVILIVIIRSVMVAKPLSSRKYLTSKRVKIFCITVPIVTFLLFVPTGLNIMWEVCYHDFNQNDVCKKFANVAWINKYLYALTILYGPILLTVYFISFVLIKINLTKANKDAEEMMNSEINSSEIQSRMQQTAKITQILVAILICECVCVIPTCLQGIGLLVAPNELVFDKTYALGNVIDVICEIFLCCRPTVNFVIYVCMHKEFRRQVAVIFGAGRLWAQSTLSDIVPSVARSAAEKQQNKQLGDSTLNITQTTTLESIQLTPLVAKKLPPQSTSSHPKDTSQAANSLKPENTSLLNKT